MWYLKVSSSIIIAVALICMIQNAISLDTKSTIIEKKWTALAELTDKYDLKTIVHRCKTSLNNFTSKLENTKSIAQEKLSENNENTEDIVDLAMDIKTQINNASTELVSVRNLVQKLARRFKNSFEKIVAFTELENEPVNEELENIQNTIVDKSKPLVNRVIKSFRRRFNYNNLLNKVLVTSLNSKMFEDNYVEKQNIAQIECSSLWNTLNKHVKLINDNALNAMETFIRGIKAIKSVKENVKNYGDDAINQMKEGDNITILKNSVELAKALNLIFVDDSNLESAELSYSEEQTKNDGTALDDETPDYPLEANETVIDDDRINNKQSAIPEIVPESINNNSVSININPLNEETQSIPKIEEKNIIETKQPNMSETIPDTTSNSSESINKISLIENMHSIPKMKEKNKIEMEPSEYSENVPDTTSNKSDSINPQIEETQTTHGIEQNDNIKIKQHGIPEKKPSLLDNNLSSININSPIENRQLNSENDNNKIKTENKRNRGARPILPWEELIRQKNPQVSQESQNCINTLEKSNIELDNIRTSAKQYIQKTKTCKDIQNIENDIVKQFYKKMMDTNRKLAESLINGANDICTKVTPIDEEYDKKFKNDQNIKRIKYLLGKKYDPNQYILKVLEDAKNKNGIGSMKKTSYFKMLSLTHNMKKETKEMDDAALYAMNKIHEGKLSSFDMSKSINKERASKSCYIKNILMEAENTEDKKHKEENKIKVEDNINENNNERIFESDNNMESRNKLEESEMKNTEEIKIPNEDKQNILIHQPDNVSPIKTDKITIEKRNNDALENDKLWNNEQKPVRQKSNENILEDPKPNLRSVVTPDNISNSHNNQLSDLAISPSKQKRTKNPKSNKMPNTINGSSEDDVTIEQQDDKPISPLQQDVNNSNNTKIPHELQNVKNDNNLSPVESEEKNSASIEDEKYPEIMGSHELRDDKSDTLTKTIDSDSNIPSYSTVNPFNPNRTIIPSSSKPRLVKDGSFADDIMFEKEDDENISPLEQDSNNSINREIPHELHKVKKGNSLSPVESEEKNSASEEHEKYPEIMGRNDLRDNEIDTLPKITGADSDTKSDSAVNPSNPNGTIIPSSSKETGTLDDVKSINTNNEPSNKKRRNKLKGPMKDYDVDKDIDSYEEDHFNENDKTKKKRKPKINDKVDDIPTMINDSNIPKIIDTENLDDNPSGTKQNNASQNSQELDNDKSLDRMKGAKQNEVKNDNILSSVESEEKNPASIEDKNDPKIIGNHKLRDNETDTLPKITGADSDTKIDSAVNTINPNGTIIPSSSKETGTLDDVKSANTNNKPSNKKRRYKKKSPEKEYDVDNDIDSYEEVSDEEHLDDNDKTQIKRKPKFNDKADDMSTMMNDSHTPELIDTKNLDDKPPSTELNNESRNSQELDDDESLDNIEGVQQNEVKNDNILSPVESEEKNSASIEHEKDPEKTVSHELGDDKSDSLSKIKGADSDTLSDSIVNTINPNETIIPNSSKETGALDDVKSANTNNKPSNNKPSNKKRRYKKKSPEKEYDVDNDIDSYEEVSDEDHLDDNDKTQIKRKPKFNDKADDMSTMMNDSHTPKLIDTENLDDKPPSTEQNNESRNSQELDNDESLDNIEGVQQNEDKNDNILSSVEREEKNSASIEHEKDPEKMVSHELGDDKSDSLSKIKGADSDTLSDSIMNTINPNETIIPNSSKETGTLDDVKSANTNNKPSNKKRRYKKKSPEKEYDVDNDTDSFEEDSDEDHFDDNDKTQIKRKPKFNDKADDMSTMMNDSHTPKLIDTENLDDKPPSTKQNNESRNSHELDDDESLDNIEGVQQNEVKNDNILSPVESEEKNSASIEHEKDPEKTVSHELVDDKSDSLSKIKGADSDTLSDSIVNTINPNETIIPNSSKETGALDDVKSANTNNKPSNKKRRYKKKSPEKEYDVDNDIDSYEEVSDEEHLDDNDKTQIKRKPKFNDKADDMSTMMNDSHTPKLIDTENLDDKPPSTEQNNESRNSQELDDDESLDSIEGVQQNEVKNDNILSPVESEEKNLASIEHEKDPEKMVSHELGDGKSDSLSKIKDADSDILSNSIVNTINPNETIIPSSSKETGTLDDVNSANTNNKPSNKKRRYKKKSPEKEYDVDNDIDSYEEDSNEDHFDDNDKTRIKRKPKFNDKADDMSTMMNDSHTPKQIDTENLDDKPPSTEQNNESRNSQELDDDESLDCIEGVHQNEVKNDNILSPVESEEKNSASIEHEKDPEKTVSHELGDDKSDSLSKINSADSDTLSDSIVNTINPNETVIPNSSKETGALDDVKSANTNNKPSNKKRRYKKKSPEKEYDVDNDTDSFEEDSDEDHFDDNDKTQIKRKPKFNDKADDMSTMMNDSHTPKLIDTENLDDKPPSTEQNNESRNSQELDDDESLDSIEGVHQNEVKNDNILSPVESEEKNSASIEHEKDPEKSVSHELCDDKSDSLLKIKDADSDTLSDSIVNTINPNETVIPNSSKETGALDDVKSANTNNKPSNKKRRYKKKSPEKEYDVDNDTDSFEEDSDEDHFDDNDKTQIKRKPKFNDKADDMSTMMNDSHTPKLIDTENLDDKPPSTEQNNESRNSQELDDDESLDSIEGVHQNEVKNDNILSPVESEEKNSASIEHEKDPEKSVSHELGDDKSDSLSKIKDADSDTLSHSIVNTINPNETVIPNSSKETGALDDVKSANTNNKPSNKKRRYKKKSPEKEYDVDNDTDSYEEDSDEDHFDDNDKTQIKRKPKFNDKADDMSTMMNDSHTPKLIDTENLDDKPPNTEQNNESRNSQELDDDESLDSIEGVQQNEVKNDNILSPVESVEKNSASIEHEKDPEKTVSHELVDDKSDSLSKIKGADSDTLSDSIVNTINPNETIIPSSSKETGTLDDVKSANTNNKPSNKKRRYKKKSPENEYDVVNDIDSYEEDSDEDHFDNNDKTRIKRKPKFNDKADDISTMMNDSHTPKLTVTENLDDKPPSTEQNNESRNSQELDNDESLDRMKGAQQNEVKNDNILSSVESEEKNPSSIEDKNDPKIIVSHKLRDNEIDTLPKITGADSDTLNDSIVNTSKPKGRKKMLKKKYEKKDFAIPADLNDSVNDDTTPIDVKSNEMNVHSASEINPIQSYEDNGDDDDGEKDENSANTTGNKPKGKKRKLRKKMITTTEINNKKTITEKSTIDVPYKENNDCVPENINEQTKDRIQNPRKKKYRRRIKTYLVDKETNERIPVDEHNYFTRDSLPNNVDMYANKIEYNKSDKPYIDEFEPIDKDDGDYSSFLFNDYNSKQCKEDAYDKFATVNSQGAKVIAYQCILDTNRMHSSMITAIKDASTNIMSARSLNDIDQCIKEVSYTLKYHLKLTLRELVKRVIPLGKTFLETAENLKESYRNGPQYTYQMLSNIMNDESSVPMLAKNALRLISPEFDVDTLINNILNTSSKTKNLKKEKDNAHAKLTNLSKHIDLATSNINCFILSTMATIDSGTDTLNFLKARRVTMTKYHPRAKELKDAMSIINSGKNIKNNVNLSLLNPNGVTENVDDSEEEDPDQVAKKNEEFLKTIPTLDQNVPIFKKVPNRKQTLGVIVVYPNKQIKYKEMNDTLELKNFVMKETKKYEHHPKGDKPKFLKVNSKKLIDTMVKDVERKAKINGMSRQGMVDEIMNNLNS